MDKAATVLGALGAAGLCPCGQELNGADAEYQDEDGLRRCASCWELWANLAIEYLQKAMNQPVHPATEERRREWWDAAASR